MKITEHTILIFLTLLWSLPGCAARSEFPLRSRPSIPESREILPGGMGPAAPGGPRVLIDELQYSRQGVASIEYRIQASGPVEKVELYTTTSAGREWELAGEDPDGLSPVEFKAPEGEYGIWIAAAAVGGPPPAPPDPGDPPRGRVVIDTTPPEVQFGEFRAARPVTAPGRIEVQLPYKVSDANEDPSAVRLEWRVAEDRWILAPGDAEAFKTGKFLFSVPEASADPLSLRITASDRAGNSSSRIEVVHPLDQIDPPRLEFLSLDDGGVYRGGSSVEVRFRVEWVRLKPGGIALNGSLDGGRTWQPVASGIDPAGRLDWKLPSIDASQVFLELSARGSCGFKAARRSRPFRIDSSPPSARIIGPRASKGRLARLSVQAQDAGPAGLDRLELYERLPGGQASKVKEFPPTDTVEFEAKGSGEIGLWLVAWDRAGNSSPLPAEDEPAPFILDLEPREGLAEGAPGPTDRGGEDGPVLSLLNFHGGVHRGGDRRYIFFNLEGPLPGEAWIDIHASSDGGKSWSEIARGVPAADGRWAWTLPREPGTARKMRLRLTATSGPKTVVAQSEADFVVECRIPRVEFRGPRASHSLRTALRFSILPPLGGTGEDTGIAPTPLSRIECWLRREGEESWFLAGKRLLEPGEGMPDAAEGPGEAAPPSGEPGEGGGPDEEPESQGGGDSEARSLSVFVEDGRYEVFLLPEDAAGNRPELPGGPAGPPARRILVDTVRPRLQVSLSDSKDIYEGGEAIGIRILAEDENLGEFPVWIETAAGFGAGPKASGEGSKDAAPGGGAEPEDWVTLARYFPRDRTYSYRMSREPGERRIRITATDLAANRSETVLRFFIAPPAPTAWLIGLERPMALRGGEPLVIRWQTRGIELSEDSGGTVTLRASRDGGRTWSDIAKAIPNSGIYTWTTPQDDIPDLRIRIEAIGAARQPASAESASITISARSPRVTLESVEPAVEGPLRPEEKPEGPPPSGGG